MCSNIKQINFNRTDCCCLSKPLASLYAFPLSAMLSDGFMANRRFHGVNEKKLLKILSQKSMRIDFIGRAGHEIMNFQKCKLYKLHTHTVRVNFVRIF